MKPLSPVSVVDLFPGERESLLDLLAGLSSGQWNNPTVCPGWSVKDVALHLLGVDVGILSRRRDGFHDHSLSDTVAEGEEWSDLVTYVDRLNEVWVTAARRISQRLLCELLRWTGDATAAYFKTLDLMALGGPVSWVGPDPVPVWLDVAREYTERWVHQQQIRDAVDRPGLKCREWFSPVLETFVRALPYTLRHAPAPDGTCLRLVIDGEAGGEWFAVRTHGGWLLRQGVEGTPDATVIMDQEIAWRVFTKGMNRDCALQTMSLQGDMSLAERVLDMVSIIA